METNALPAYDTSDNPTGCCPRFNPEGWDDCELHFKDKRFLRATTHSVMHVPLNMGQVFARVQSAIDNADAQDSKEMIVLSRELSPWKAEHFFSVTSDVAGEEMTALSGDYVTRVFEGEYRQVKDWHAEMEELVRARGVEPKRVRFYYTTCPKCAKVYGKNYVVGVAEV